MIAELAHELLPYAVALYAADGLVRVREGERMLCAPWGRRFRWLGPGWHWVGLLPMAEVFVLGGAPLRSAERDLAAVRASRAIQRRYTGPLAIAAALLFATTFGALPLAAYRYREAPSTVEAVIAVAGMLWVVIMILAARALRKAGSTRAAVASALAPALFFPPAAAHILSFLWRDAFRASPSMAPAAVLLTPDRLRHLIRQELRRLDEAERAPVAAAATRTHASREEILALLSALGIEPRTVAADDPPMDAQAAVFCPLCETEYRSGFQACTDCDVPLKPFSTRPGTG